MNEARHLSMEEAADLLEALSARLRAQEAKAFWALDCPSYPERRDTQVEFDLPDARQVCLTVTYFTL